MSLKVNPGAAQGESAGAGSVRKRLRLVKELGILGSLAYLARRRFGTEGAASRMHPRSAMHPLYFRRGSSDPMVFSQIFLEKEYGPLCDLKDVRLVIDCGANVGYSSAFFLSHFPTCQVIAVEPNPSNHAMLERNLRQYGSRAQAVRAGIWSHCGPLKISRQKYRDGKEWSFQVQPCAAHEQPDFEGVTVDSLLESSGFERISLLKIDIEGAEAAVFREKADWLDRVDALAIELHDDSQFGRATEVFHAAIEGRGFKVSHSGELTICRR